MGHIKKIPSMEVDSAPVVPAPAAAAPAPAAAPAKKPAAKKKTPAAKKSAPRARQAATAISKKLNCENMIIETVVNNPSRSGHSVRKLLDLVKQENKYNNDLALKRALKNFFLRTGLSPS